MEKNASRKIGILLISLFVLLVLAAVFVWRIAELLPGGHDARYHFPQTAKYAIAILEAPERIFDLLKSDPVRYPPLTFLVGGLILWLCGFAFNSYIITTLFFLLVFIGALLLLGRKYSENKMTLLLPFVAVWAAPTMWEVAYSFNLEASLLAGGMLIMAMALYGGKIKSRVSLVFMTLAMVPFALSKTVILVPLVPAMLVLCIFPTSRERKIQFLFLLTLLATSGAWIIPRMLEVAPEMAVDFENPHHAGQGIFYYPALVLFSYRGIILICALLVMLWARHKEGDWKREDIAFGIFFLSSIIFYTFIDTKRPWYMLLGYSILPVWFLFSAKRLKSRKWARITTVFVAGFYTLLVLLNTAITFAVSTESFIKGLPVMGLRRPVSFTEKEKFIVNLVKEDFAKNPRQSFALFLTSGDFTLDRIYGGLVLAQPGMALNERIFIADKGALNLALFVNNLPNSTVLYSLGKNPPKIEMENIIKDDKSMDIQKLSVALAGYENFFIKTGTIKGAQNLVLTRYVNIEPAAGYIHLNPMELAFYDKGNTNIQDWATPFADSKILKDYFSNSFSPQALTKDSDPKEILEKEVIEKISILKQASMDAYNAGDFTKASKTLTELLKISPIDHQARLLCAKSLSKEGKTRQALYHWDLLFKGTKVFGQKIEALTDLAHFEAEGSIPWGTFGRYINPLFEEYADDQPSVYSLYSTKILACQLQQDWHQAERTITRMSSILKPEQMPGVNLSLAMVLSNLGKNKRAIKLLRKNMDNLEKGDPVYVDSAFKLAEILADQGAFNELKSPLESALAGKFDTNSFANTVIYIGAKMQKAEKANLAKELYMFALSKITGEAAGRIEIEVGNLERASGNTEKAKEYYLKALKKISDPNIHNWIAQVIQEL